MKFWLTILLLGLPALSWAQGTPAAQAPSATQPQAQEPILRAQATEPGAHPVTPPTPPPADLIPAAPENPGTPPQQTPGVTEQMAAPTGQWVYTGQYGWVWMPYGNAYTYVPPNGDAPDMYLYYPSVGWAWVVAPWIWGWGPMPYWGLYGTAGYGWYGYGYGRWYGYGGPYAGWYGRGYWSGGRWYGVGGSPYHYAAPRGGYYVPPGGGAHGVYTAPHGGASVGHVGGGHGGGGHR